MSWKPSALLTLFALAVVGCEDDAPISRKLLASVPAEDGTAVEIYWNWPGSIQSEYQTLEIRKDGTWTRSLSVFACEAMAVRANQDSVAAVIYQGEVVMRAAQLEKWRGRSLPKQAIDVVTRMVDRPATPDDLARLSEGGYTVVPCIANLPRDRPLEGVTQVRPSELR